MVSGGYAYNFLLNCAEFINKDVVNRVRICMLNNQLDTFICVENLCHVNKERAD